MKFRFRPIGLANTQWRLFMKEKEYSDIEGNRNRIKWTLWVSMGVSSCYFWVWELVACFWDISINRPQIGLAGLEWRSRPKISDKFKWSKHTVRILFVSMHPSEIPPINGIAAFSVYVSRAPICLFALAGKQFLSQFYQVNVEYGHKVGYNGCAYCWWFHQIIEKWRLEVSSQSWKAKKIWRWTF